jgi:hypothetical protein
MAMALDRITTRTTSIFAFAIRHKSIPEAGKSIAEKIAKRK